MTPGWSRRVPASPNGAVGTQIRRTLWGFQIEMSELEPAGYRWLRARVFERWRYLAILDDDGRELCRLDCMTDPRIARTINDATAEVVVECSLRGDDPEFLNRLPVRIAATALYPAPDTDYRSLVSYSPGTLAEPSNGVTLEHRCHIPQSLLEEVTS